MILRLLLRTGPDKGIAGDQEGVQKGGKIILVEHIRPRGSLLGKIVDLLNPIMVRVMGVNINRNTVENMERAGPNVVEEKNLFRDVVNWWWEILEAGKGRPFPYRSPSGAKIFCSSTNRIDVSG